MVQSDAFDELKLAIKSFWEDCHKEGRVSSLSGSSCDVLLKSLALSTLQPPGNRILEVGVGLGYVTEGLYLQGVSVSALDISQEALEHVAKFCEAVYTTDDLKDLPSAYFDTVICANVVQHIPTPLLKEELAACIRALKPVDGLMALQFVSSRLAEDTGMTPSLYTVANGMCFRTPSYMQELIASVGGHSDLVIDDLCNKEEIAGSHVLHIRRIANV